MTTVCGRDAKAVHYKDRQNHEHNSKDDFRTPLYLWEYLNSIHRIEYDGACTPGLNNLAQPLRLEDEWPSNSVVYSNPPYDMPSIQAWFEKGQELVKKGGIHIMLLPEKMCQVGFHHMLNQFDEIIFLGGRVNFISPYATPGGTSMTGNIITIQRPWEFARSNGLWPKIKGVLIRDLKKGVF